MVSEADLSAQHVDRAPAATSPGRLGPEIPGKARERDTASARVTRIRGFLIVLAAFLFLATYYNISTPLFEAPDELQHAAYAVWLVDVRSLPVLDPKQPGPWGQEGTQGPLYYLLVATSLGTVRHRTADNLAVLNPQANIGEPLTPGNKNRVLHDPQQEQWPYQGTTLFIHLARAISTVLAMGSLWAIYRLGRLAFPGTRGIALAMTALVAFTPQFLFLSSSVTNDNLVILIASWTLVLLAAWLRSPRLPTWQQLGLLGVLLGLAVLAKLSGVLLWPLAVGILVWLAWRSSNARWLARAGLFCFAIALAVCGWWLVRNQQLYGDLTAIRAHAAALGGQRQDLPSTIRDILGEFRGFRYSLWGLFGWFNVLVPAVFYHIVDGMATIGVLGFGFFVIRSLFRQARSTREIVLMLCVWLGLVAGGVLRWTVLISSQGRLAFPALAAAALFLVIGWSELVPRLLHRAVSVAGLTVWAAWAALCPALVIRPAYARPPALSLAEVAARVSHQTNVTFQGGVTLLGYQVDRQSLAPGDLFWVTACWSGDRKVQADYFVFVQLLVDNDLIAAQADTYHGLGSFPTSFWPAGVVFCDQYPLRVADTVPSPGSGSISMGLYAATGKRLPVVGSEWQPQPDQVRFPAPPISFPKAGRTLDYQWGPVALVDYQLDTTAVIPGGTFDISLTWSAAKPIPTDYAATVQVLDDQGAKAGQSDVLLQTSTWQVGARLTDRRSITISPDAVAGVYQLKLAVYDPATVRNLPLSRQQQLIPGGGLLKLWTLRVVSR